METLINANQIIIARFEAAAACGTICICKDELYFPPLKCWEIQVVPIKARNVGMFKTSDQLGHVGNKNKPVYSCLVLSINVGEKAKRYRKT